MSGYQQANTTFGLSYSECLHFIRNSKNLFLQLYLCCIDSVYGWEWKIGKKVQCAMNFSKINITACLQSKLAYFVSYFAINMTKQSYIWCTFNYLNSTVKLKVFHIGVHLELISLSHLWSFCWSFYQFVFYYHNMHLQNEAHVAEGPRFGVKSVEIMCFMSVVCIRIPCPRQGLARMAEVPETSDLHGDTECGKHRTSVQFFGLPTRPIPGSHGTASQTLQITQSKCQNTM